MNEVNRKYRFSGSDSSETLRRIFKQFGTVDYVGDPTPHANVGGSVGSKGACLRMREVVAVASIFSFLFRSHAHRYRLGLGLLNLPSFGVGK